jgi:hypothetical protein
LARLHDEIAHAFGSYCQVGGGHLFSLQGLPLEAVAMWREKRSKSAASCRS